jgi:hypothetical protein
MMPTNGDLFTHCCRTGFISFKTINVFYFNQYSKHSSMGHKINFFESESDFKYYSNFWYSRTMVWILQEAFITQLLWKMALSFIVKTAVKTLENYCYGFAYQCFACKWLCRMFCDDLNDGSEKSIYPIIIQS